MRIAHLADVHLGYRAYNRVTSQGINRREADVFNTFRQALSRIVEIQPDLIIIAGDLFHTVRPSNLVIQHAFGEFLNLRKNLYAPIVIIGGNHDSPKAVDTGCILDLLTNVPNVQVAHNEYCGVRIASIDTSVFCLCHRALTYLNEMKVEPDPQSSHNILAVHGCVEGLSRDFGDIYMIRPSDILHDGWDYVACGHYHIHTKLADNAYYSGSIDFTSFNIWEESGTPKGFIVYDTDKREAAFHEVTTRDVIDLRPIDAGILSAEQINSTIENHIKGIDGGHTDKIIRLVIENLRREVQKDLDYSLIRRIKSEALHFEVQCRQPKRDSQRASDGGTQSRPLEVEWQEFVRDTDLAAGVNREKLTERGLEYLGKQEAVPE